MDARSRSNNPLDNLLVGQLRRLGVNDIEQDQQMNATISAKMIAPMWLCRVKY
jgi:hypothetical protein